MKRKALFVGINAYNDDEIANLRFAISDAVAVHGQLVGLGFETKYLFDLDTTREKILRAYRDFTEDLSQGDVFLFYFAGHGYAPRGSDEQLLVARDDVWGTIRLGCGGGVQYNYLRRTLEERGCHSIFVLDACRSNIVANARGVRDLVPGVPKESLVGESKCGGTTVAMRSCRPDQCAYEVPKLEHGLYTYALLEVVKARVERGEALTFDCALSDAVAREMKSVAMRFGITGEQDPEFVKAGYDLPCVWPLDRPPTSPAPNERVDPVQAPAKRSEPVVSPPRPDTAAPYRVIDLATGTVTSFADVPADGWTDEYKTSKLVLRRIEPGSFTMGSPLDEEGRSDNETPHRVTLTKPYYIGVFEVTQGQWELVMENNPAHFRRSALRPVEEVSWDDCQAFCRRVGQSVRLPTEAEWENACRAGASGPYSWGARLNGDRANCDGTYPNGTLKKGPFRRETSDVGAYEANPWGLYDMHGNVREWCQDWYAPYAGDATDPTGPSLGNIRVCRGGAWCDNARCCRAASREYGSRSDRVGLRVCCSAEGNVEN